MTDWRAALMAPWRPGVGDVLRIVLRGLLVGGVTYGGLVVLLLLRLVEAPVWRTRRPLTPHITQAVCRAALALMGLRLQVTGRPMAQPGAIVANHCSWLDIFALNACDRVYFVSKAEVARWPGIGWLARATGTVFIARKGTEAREQQALFESRLIAGHRLLFFPEGTSTDSIRVLPFKSTLFAAFFAPPLVQALHIQPVSLVYHAPDGADPRFYGWWAEMDFGSSLARVLAQPRQGRIEVIFHDPVAVSAFPDRKTLSAHCERVIRSAHDAAHAAAGRPVGQP